MTQQIDHLNTLQITEEEDDAFAISTAAVDSTLLAVREQLSRKSLTTICLECGDPIGEARLKAMPSATLCIDCQEYEDRRPKE